jgi:putative membrane protein (TIGR04086 family)
MRTPGAHTERTDVRWMAVFVGFWVDAVISVVIRLFTMPDEQFLMAPDIGNPDHLLILALLTISTGVGGYVAGRIAKSRNALHGLLVGVVGILIAQLDVASGGPMPARPFIIASAVGCMLGALGGLASMHANRPKGSLL